VNETIKCIAERAFKYDWFNKEHMTYLTYYDFIHRSSFLNILTVRNIFILILDIFYSHLKMTSNRSKRRDIFILSFYNQIDFNEITH